MDSLLDATFGSGRSRRYNRRVARRRDCRRKRNLMASSKPVTKMIWFLSIFGMLMLACNLATLAQWSGKSTPSASREAQRLVSNGERIYFTATNEQGEFIPYEGGPAFGGMMMQPRLACVSCHGADGRGGTHVMHMQVMDAPDIRYEALNSEAGEHENNKDGMEHTQGEYVIDAFRQAVVEGKHPDGEALSADMPRWTMSDEDLAALLEYLKLLP